MVPSLKAVITRLASNLHHGFVRTFWCKNKRQDLRYTMKLDQLPGNPYSAKVTIAWLVLSHGDSGLRLTACPQPVPDAGMPRLVNWLTHVKPRISAASILKATGISLAQ